MEEEQKKKQMMKFTICMCQATPEQAQPVGNNKWWRFFFDIQILFEPTVQYSSQGLQTQIVKVWLSIARDF